jgi:hypothetical protein
MKRPSFQFYPADWRNNANLRRCSEAARGAWMDIICVLHDSDEYGVIRWSLADLARASGVPIKLAKELADKLVLKGGDSNVASFTYTTRHAGKDGPTHTLIQACDGPCWYSSRLVRDEWVRNRSGGETRFKSPSHSPSHRHGEPKGEAPTVAPCQPDGTGASSSSSSSSSSSKKTPIPPKGVDGGFERFWKAYPKRVGKIEAIKAWSKIESVQEKIEIILAAVETQKNSSAWTKESGAFIPHPSTWLNQGRWMDEPVKIPTKTFSVFQQG